MMKQPYRFFHNIWMQIEWHFYWRFKDTTKADKFWNEFVVPTIQEAAGVNKSTSPDERERLIADYFSKIDKND